MKTVWKGSLNFALLSVGVKMYKATGESGVKFRMLHKDCNTPMNMKRWCAKCQKELAWEDLVKGYEVDEEHFIIFTDEEIASLTEEGNKSIKVSECINTGMIDDVAFEDFYYMIPEKGFERAYLLLRESLISSNLCLVGNWIYRGKEHIVSVKARDGFLLLSTLRYAEEINNINELPPVATKEIPSPEEIALGVELLKKFTKTEFKLPDSSSFAAKFTALMNKKSVGAISESVKVVESPKPKDLMAELRASIEAATSTK